MGVLKNRQTGYVLQRFFLRTKRRQVLGSKIQDTITRVGLRYLLRQKNRCVFVEFKSGENKCVAPVTLQTSDRVKDKNSPLDDIGELRKTRVKICRNCTYIKI